MDFRLASARLALVAAVIAVVMGAAHDARAQAALDDDDDDQTAPAVTAESPSNETMVGVGLRLRSVFIPKGLIELFVDHAPGGSAEWFNNIGLEVTRKKGNFELVFGVEWDHVDIEKGRWVEKGKAPPQEEVDNVTFDNFGLIAADVTFYNHTPFGRYFALRYGGGAGLGLVLGSVKHTDERCLTSDLDSCMAYIGGATDKPYDIPPVLPIINAVVGAKITPIENLAITIEGGIRTLPFFGVSGTYYF